MKKQISIVLESDGEFDELDFMKKMKNFLYDFEEVKLVGTHTKLLKFSNESSY